MKWEMVEFVMCFSSQKCMGLCVCGSLHMEWGLTVPLWGDAMVPEFNFHSGDLHDDRSDSHALNIQISAACGLSRGMTLSSSIYMEFHLCHTQQFCKLGMDNKMITIWYERHFDINNKHIKNMPRLINSLSYL